MCVCVCVCGWTPVQVCLQSVSVMSSDVCLERSSLSCLSRAAGDCF